MLLRSISAVLIAGLCWWLSYNLELHWWLPIWLAPIPVLWLAPRLPAFGAFGIGFGAFLLGRLAWLPYLWSVLPRVPAIIFTLLPALLFGLTALPARAFLRRGQPLLAALSFAAPWTAIEFLVSILGRDGTIVSIAYTQSSFLPVIQLASLTGVAGITFVLCFVPALIAGALQTRRIWIWPVGIAVVVLGFGFVRLRTGEYGAPVKVGMVALEERLYGGNVYERRADKELAVFGRYCGEIGKLGEAGMKVVIIPEKALPLTDTTVKEVYDSLAQTAARLKIFIVAGVTRIEPHGMSNLAPVFGPEGRLLVDYKKVNLFEGEAIEGFGRGSEPGIFGAEGVAICKDFDFERYMRNYGRAGLSLIYDPAWDFVRDGWWHSRVAIVGAVAQGYSLVRNAREGRFTISDDRGRVDFEVSSEGRELTTMTGTVRPSTGHTLYSRWGDWFGWLMIAISVFVLIYLAASRSLTRV
jgi:apolipoprotein N-acyltransferase